MEYATDTVTGNNANAENIEARVEVLENAANSDADEISFYFIFTHEHSMILFLGHLANDLIIGS